MKTRSQTERELQQAAEESGELLGRGCRVSRPPHSLDEDYMRESLYGSQYKRKRGFEEAEINERYPQRDAAKRALTSLRETMSQLSEDSNAFHFKHHPESSPTIRYEDSSDSSFESSKNQRSIASKSPVQRNQRAVAEPPRGDFKRRRSQDSVVSISDVSLRADSASLSHASLDSLSDGDTEEESPAQAKEVLRQASNAAEDSVNRNIDINHYLSNVIKTVDTHRIKTKEIDRRFRHLFIAEKKAEKSSAPEGTTEANLGDISPLSIDESVTFDSVGGLPGHIVTLREVLLFPLLYPDLLSRFHLRPPRGVLFVGPPGTGKTLMARALANEGSRSCHPRITFFMRKGADILSKWVGESERQLSLLFEEAKKRKPSIIFFDEIDGLAPVRHSKSEQSHAALVSTLLALMDGLDDRGQVVVIGATNRPDTIDPALRRPGRFDRELLFPYPNKAARKHVLSIVTDGLLQTAPDRENIIDDLVSITEGFSGADLKALCVEAGLNRLRTSLPQLYVTSKKMILPNMDNFSVSREDFFIAAQRIQPSQGVKGTGGVFLEEHWDYLLGEIRHTIVVELSQHWSSAEKILKEEKVDCSDVGAAVKILSEFPVPSSKQAFMLLIEGQQESSIDLAECVALSLLKRFSSFRSSVVHMLNLEVDFEPWRCISNGIEDHFSTGHVFQFVTHLQRCSPSVVVLQGVEAWLSVNSSVADSDSHLPDEEKVTQLKALIYYLNTLRDVEVLILVPCQNCAIIQQVLTTVDVPLCIPTRTTTVHSALSPTQVLTFVQYLFRIFLATLLSKSESMASVELEEDTRIPEPVLKPETKNTSAETIALWRKVEYRRLQLRHVLAKWVGQYISSGKYRILHSGELDLTPDTPLWNDWKSHTKRTNIGLSDILEKIESGQYVCLSQYYNDIDMLVRNVRSFFRSRSPLDAKYRLKALDLKRTVVLSLYKINKSLIRFCEEHMNVVEPSEEVGDAREQPKATRSLLQATHQPRAPPRRNRSVMWGRRRKKRVKRYTQEIVERAEDSPPRSSDEDELANDSLGQPAEALPPTNPDVTGASQAGLSDGAIPTASAQALPHSDAPTTSSAAGGVPPPALVVEKKSLECQLQDLALQLQECTIVALHFKFIGAMKYLQQLQDRQKAEGMGKSFTTEEDVVRELGLCCGS